MTRNKDDNPKTVQQKRVWTLAQWTLALAAGASLAGSFLSAGLPWFTLFALLFLIASALCLALLYLENKLSAIQAQLNEMPFEVRRKLYLKRGELYWPEKDMVVSFPSPTCEDGESQG